MKYLILIVLFSLLSGFYLMSVFNNIFEVVFFNKGINFDIFFLASIFLVALYLCITKIF